MERILLVDDQRESIRGVESALKEKGYDVLYAASGKEALAFLDKETVSGVILDLEMPGMNGPEILTAIRKNPKTQDLPVIIYSAVVDFDQKESLQTQALEADALAGIFGNTHLIKPTHYGQGIASYVRAVSPNEVVRAIQEAMGKTNK